jgi:cytochrome c biogenesis protein CcmG/thiol:disulfide interchange protein DsbE
VKRKLFLSLLVLAICGGVFLVARPKFRARQIGSVDRALAPDFTLTDLSGRPLTLSSYRGKVILLDFWATWCDPCRDEIPRFNVLQDKYRGRGLQIIGVSMDDSPNPVRDFQQQFKMNYPVVMGSARIGELYGGILGLPVAVLIGPDGRIYSKHFGATDTAVLEKEIVTLLPTAPVS